MDSRRNWQATGILTLLLLGAALLGHSVAASSPAANSQNGGQKEIASQLNQVLSPACTVTYNETILLTDPNQIGRLITLLSASTCALPRGCPGIFDNLPRHYRSYPFTNNNTGPTCVTVNLTPGLTGVLLQSAAYLGSFNPLNPCENYLADIGPVPTALGGQYSFTVQPGATYVVVVSGFLPGVGSLPYTLRVTSDPNCPVPVGGTPTSTPNPATQTSIPGTQTAIAGTQTSIAGTQTALAGSATPTPNTCPTYSGIVELSDPLQVGRLNTLTNSSTCGSPRGCPGVADTLPRNYDSYTFTNSNTGPTCVTVRLTPGLTGVLLQSATYLSSFNPLNPCENYLGDIGPVPDALGGSYSIIVPGGATYMVVVSAFLPGVGSLPYTLNVTSNPNCPILVGGTPTPNQTSIAGTQTAIIATLTAIAGTQTAITGSATPTPNTCPTYSGIVELSDPLQVGRLNTLLTSSTCASPRGCPGVADTLARNYDSYTFTNNNTGPTCVTVRLTPGLTGVLLQSATYLSSFNPLNPCENYLGDIGPVPGVLGGSYSIIVPGGATYVVVVSGFIPGVGSLPYTLNVISNPNCPILVGGTPTATPNSATRTAIAGTQTALAGSMTPTGTPNSGTQTSIAGTQTSIAGTQTSVAGTQTSIAGTQTSVAGTQTALAGSMTPTGTSNPATRTSIAGTQTSIAGTQTAISGTQTSIAGTQTALAGTSTPMPTACTRQYTDVPPDHLFYTWIRCLTCRGIMSGYQCGGPNEPCDANNNGYFRPFNNIIRGQISKIVSNSAGFIEDPGVQIYTDVPTSNTFYQWINRLSRRGHMSGYPCGGPFEPCDASNSPYFRPFANATRGQLSKIVSNTAGFSEPVSGQFYTDVTADNPFYEWIMRLTNRGVMSGYLCGEQPGEPCDSENRPYFRPFNEVTRGQASKIDANTFFPNCQTPFR